jgi:hypothetical protein
MEIFKEMSREVVEYIRSREALNISVIERDLKMPASTLSKAVGGTRDIPPTWLYELIRYLIPYGLKFKGYDWTLDDDNTPYIFGRKWLENIEKRDGDDEEHSVYYVKEIRLLAGDLFDFC